MCAPTASRPSWAGAGSRRARPLPSFERLAARCCTDTFGIPTIHVPSDKRDNRIHWQDRDMADGIAVVTGASSGIGAATARRLAAEGFTVVAAARRTERLTTLAAETGAVPVRCDITSDEDVVALRATVEQLPGELTLLVNNAGGAFGADPVSDADIEDWRAMYEINVLGTVRVTKALLPLLDASGAGTIVMMGSTAGLITYEG